MPAYRTIAVAEGKVAGLFEALRDLPAVAALAALNAVALGSARLLKVAAKERFTGRGPFPVADGKLGVRTGLMRRSLQATRPQVVTGGAVQTRLSATVKYWAAHEFGGTQDIKAHRRKVATRDIFAAGQRIASGVAQVRAHKRRVPERRPLGTAIDEHAEKIYMEEFETALQAALDTRERGGLA